MIPVLCFPATKGSDLTLDTMNWTCLVYGGIMFLSLLWYAVDARRWFKGPRLNLEHMIHDEQKNETIAEQKNEML
jgi:hypothetical protein